MSRLASCLFVLGLMACGSNSDAGGDESSSSTTGDPTTSSSTSTTIDPTAATTSSTTEVADSTETGPTTLTISGVVEDFFAMVPIGYAQISLVDDPEVDTVSNPDGTYAIDGLEPGSFHRIRLDGNANYWGAIIPATLEDESIDDYDLSQVSTEVIDLQTEALVAQDPTVVIDERASVLLVSIRQNTATGATVLIDPPPAPATYYAPDANGAPILNSNVIEWGLFPVAIFFNLPPGDAGTYTIEVTHPDRECTVEDPQPPTLPRHINLVYVDCL